MWCFRITRKGLQRWHRRSTVIKHLCTKHFLGRLVLVVGDLTLILSPRFDIFSIVTLLTFSAWVGLASCVFGSLWSSCAIVGSSCGIILIIYGIVTFEPTRGASRSNLGDG